MVSRPGFLGIKHPSGASNPIFITLHPQCQCQCQCHIAADGQSISKSWCRAPSGAHDQIFSTVWQLRSCFCEAPSLTRGRVCLLYMLLVLASVVFLGSETLGTRDHILLSQIWDFPFRRLLRLAGSRWRYSNPPPRGWYTLNWTLSLAYFSARTTYKTPFIHCCSCVLCRGNVFPKPLARNGIRKHRFSCALCSLQ
jgi:hypothetical protein